MENKKIIVGSLTEEFLMSHYDEFLYLEKEWGASGERPWNQEKFFQERPNKWELSSYASFDSNLAGYTIISADKEACIHKTIIGCKYRGYGIWRLLLDETKRRCLEKGFKTCKFKVRTDNCPANKIYRKNNVSYLGTDVSWDGVERYLCQLKL